MMNVTADQLFADVEPRVLRLAAISVVLLALAAGYLYLVKPAWVQYADVKFQHAQASSGLPGGGENSDATILQAEREVEDLRNTLYGGAANIPRAEIESFVVDALDRISEVHGVRLLGITPDVSDRVLMFEELPYTVEVSGSFFALHKWLYTVERELRPMVVKRFELSPSRDRSVITLNLKIVAYRSDRGAAT